MRTPAEIVDEVERVNELLEDLPGTKSRVTFPITRDEANALAEHFDDPRPGFESFFKPETFTLFGILLVVSPDR